MHQHQHSLTFKCAQSLQVLLYVAAVMCKACNRHITLHGFQQSLEVEQLRLLLLCARCKQSQGVCLLLALLLHLHMVQHRKHRE